MAAAKRTEKDEPSLREIKTLCEEIKIDVAKTQALLLALAATTGVTEAELRQTLREKRGVREDLVDPSPVEVDPEN